MPVALIDYGSGNLRSAAKAFERAVAEAGSGETVRVTADADEVARAERIVLPGVGAFADCRRGLDAVPGMVDALAEAVLRKGRPFLGICVGAQLLFEWGREHGDHRGLGWIAGDVVALDPADRSLRIPHMGWNQLDIADAGKSHPVLAGLESGRHAYFVHSYVFEPRERAQVLATAEYGGAFAAAIGRDNIVGTQFHPEKSQETGLTLIANFLRWRP